MTIYIPKTGKTFNTPRSCVNHIRKHYNTIEEAYCDVYPHLAYKKCKYCDNTSIFNSFASGYHIRCNSNECLKKIIY